MARWYEPGLSRGRALLYLPAAALASCPGLAVGWLIVTATGAPAQVWAVLGPAPYACLGVLLALWRPGGPAGVTVLGLGSVVAFLLGMLLTLSSHIPALAVMLGGCYCVAPPVLGVLWAYAVLREG